MTGYEFYDLLDRMRELYPKMDIDDQDILEEDMRIIATRHDDIHNAFKQYDTKYKAIQEVETEHMQDSSDNYNALGDIYQRLYTIHALLDDEQTQNLEGRILAVVGYFEVLHKEIQKAKAENILPSKKVTEQDIRYAIEMALCTSVLPVDIYDVQQEVLKELGFEIDTPVPEKTVTITRGQLIDAYRHAQALSTEPGHIEEELLKGVAL